MLAKIKYWNSVETASMYLKYSHPLLFIHMAMQLVNYKSEAWPIFRQ